MGLPYHDVRLSIVSTQDSCLSLLSPYLFFLKWMEYQQNVREMCDYQGCTGTTGRLARCERERPTATLEPVRTCTTTIIILVLVIRRNSLAFHIFTCWTRIVMFNRDARTNTCNLKTNIINLLYLRGIYLIYINNHVVCSTLLPSSFYSHALCFLSLADSTWTF